jgi:hypothetical protein
MFPYIEIFKFRRVKSLNELPRCCGMYVNQSAAAHTMTMRAGDQHSASVSEVKGMKKEIALR